MRKMGRRDQGNVREKRDNERLSRERWQNGFQFFYEALILMVRISDRRAVLSVCAGVLDGAGTARVLDPTPLDVRIQFCVANSSLK